MQPVFMAFGSSWSWSSAIPTFTTKRVGEVDRLWRQRMHRFTYCVRAPRRGTRVLMLRAVGYWLGWLGIFLSCSMTWSRL